MKLQFDHELRIVSPDNLRAMCAYASGMCHTYKVEKVTKNFAWVTYSNPSEYGTPRPVTALFPVIPYSKESAVVLTIHEIKNETDSEDWQYFNVIIDAEFMMFRNPQDDLWYAYKIDKSTPSYDWKRISDLGIKVIDCNAPTAAYSREDLEAGTYNAGCYTVRKD